MTESNSKKAPERTCLICRKQGGKGELLRFVCDAEGKVVFDKQGKLPGRGAYVHARLSCVLKMPGNKSWRHAFKKKEVNGESIKELLPRLCEEALTD